MKNMIDEAYEFLKTKSTADFNGIFTHVLNVMRSQWLTAFGERNFKDVEDDKRAELYTLLSIDGRFVRDAKQMWSLVEDYSYEEVRRMNINISENIETEEN